MVKGSLRSEILQSEPTRIHTHPLTPFHIGLKKREWPGFGAEESDRSAAVLKNIQTQQGE